MYWFLRNILWVVLRIIFRIEVNGKENIKGDDRLIICSNHISLLDPIILAITYNRQIHFMAKKELFDIPVFGRVFNMVGCIQVDRDKADIKSVKESLKILKGEKVLGIFPEGTRVKTVSQENLKEGIGLMASKSNSNILPVHIVTEYKLFRKVVVNYRPVVEMEQFKDIPKEDKKRIITLAVYNEIYKVAD